MKITLFSRAAILLLCLVMILVSYPAVAETSASTAKEPFSYMERIPAETVKNLTIGDFLDKSGMSTGNLDARVGTPATQLLGSNWFAAPSLTRYLSRMAKQIYYAPSYVDGNGDEVVEPGNEIEIPPNAGGGGGPSRPSYSTTTVQVEGIDEADTIKSDGKYIYYLNRYKGVAVLRAGSAPIQLSTLRPSPKEYPYYENLYISGNTLIVTECSGSHYYNTDTTFFLYDVSSPQNPKLVRTVNLPGRNITTRFLNNRLYFVTEFDQPDYSRALPLDKALPAYHDSLLSSNRYLVPPEDIYLLTQSARFTMSFSAIGSFTLTEPVDFSVYEGNVSGVYMNHKNLYIVNQYNWGSYNQREQYAAASPGLEFKTREGAEPHKDSYINRFAVINTGLTFQKMGIAKGAPLNQYSMDEYDATFRIATTYRNSNWTMYNSVQTFTASSMAPLGSLMNLAKGETIQSARFTGSMAYLVTFRQMDPLFAIDLKDPAKPILKGELKIPGFSSYLHPIGDNLVIGVGKAGDDEGAYGVKVSMFDVTDPKNPKELHSLQLGNDLTFSEAVTDPKAILFDMQKQIVALPLEVYQAKTIYEDGWSYEDWFPSWSGGVVLNFSRSGFSEKGRFSFGTDSEGSRIAYIGNVIYYVCDKGLMTINYNNYQVINRINLVF